MAGFNLNSLLNAKSQNTVSQPDKDNKKAFEIVMIDVEDLVPSADNFYSTENIDELAAAIELAGGIEQNLVVKEKVHGKHEVIVGHRRRLAILKLLKEGKEEYRKVPCRIRKHSDDIMDMIRLIITNSSARQLTDWEKVQQTKELKELLLKLRQQLEEENKEKPEEEKIKLGRIRDVLAQMLNVSPTQVGRMEAIDNNLSDDFKEELRKGNINISTAHELSRLDEEKQTEAYGQYEEMGELHIKDVKGVGVDDDCEAGSDEKGCNEAGGNGADGNMEESEDITTSETSQDDIKENVSDSDTKAAVPPYIRGCITGKNPYGTCSCCGAGGVKCCAECKIDCNGRCGWYENDNVSKTEESVTGTSENVIKESENVIRQGGCVQEYEEQLPGQQDISDYPEYVPEPMEKNMSFSRWIKAKYGFTQINQLQKIIREVIYIETEAGNNCPMEWEEKLALKISVWVMNRAIEYQYYLTAGLHTDEEIEQIKADMKDRWNKAAESMKNERVTNIKTVNYKGYDVQVVGKKEALDIIDGGMEWKD